MKYTVLVLPIWYLGRTISKVESEISVTKEFVTAEFNLEKLSLVLLLLRTIVDCCLWIKETIQLSMGVSAKELCHLTELTAESRQHNWLLFLCGLQL